MPLPGPFECAYMQQAEKWASTGRTLVSVIIVLTYWIYIMAPFSSVVMEMGCFIFNHFLQLCIMSLAVLFFPVQCDAWGGSDITWPRGFLYQSRAVSLHHLTA